MFLHMGMVISSHLRSSSRPLDAAAKRKSETRSQNVTAITARDWSSNCSCFLLAWRFCTVWSIACQPLSFDKQYWQTDISQSEDSPTLVNDRDPILSSLLCDSRERRQGRDEQVLYIITTMQYSIYPCYSEIHGMDLTQKWRLLISIKSTPFTRKSRADGQKHVEWHNFETPQQMYGVSPPKPYLSYK